MKSSIVRIPRIGRKSHIQVYLGSSMLIPNFYYKIRIDGVFQQKGLHHVDVHGASMLSNTTSFLI